MVHSDNSDILSMLRSFYTDKRGGENRCLDSLALFTRHTDYGYRCISSIGDISQGDLTGGIGKR